MPRIDSPNTPLSDELELLATLGLSEIGKCPTENDSETPSDVSKEHSAFVAEIVAFTELSHRYWVLYDSQHLVVESGAKAVRSKIGKAGGTARSENFDPVKKSVLKFAFAGLRRSAKQKLKYGRWSKHFDIWNDIHDMLTEIEQKKVQPSTIQTWIRDAYPKLISPKRKK